MSLQGRVLITGADGFVGRHLEQMLIQRGVTLRAAVRGRAERGAHVCAVGDIGPQTAWSAALEDVQAVVHLAARVHVLHDLARDPRSEFMRVNAEGTAALVRAAAAAGVRRFVYVSTVHVLGKETVEAPFQASSPPNPQGAYAESKLAGEVAARSAAGSKLQVVVIRPPLVYGPGVRANFLRLLHWVETGWPLPLGSVQNRRSLVNVWNLCDLLVKLIEHPAAADRVWLVSDGVDLSTPELVRRIAEAMARRPRLLPVPVALLRVLGRFTGLQNQIAQLCNSLAVDATPAREQLGWSPPVALSAALDSTVGWYLAQRNGGSAGRRRSLSGSTRT